MWEKLRRLKTEPVFTTETCYMSSAVYYLFNGLRITELKGVYVVDALSSRGFEDMSCWEIRVSTESFSSFPLLRAKCYKNGIKTWRIGKERITDRQISLKSFLIDEEMRTKRWRRRRMGTSNYHESRTAVIMILNSIKPRF